MGQAAAAGGSSLLAMGLSAASTIEKGEGEKAADDFKAAQAEQAARFGREQAELTDVTLRERLNNTLANIESVRAAAHTDPTSPTESAVMDWQRTISDRQRTAQVVSQKAQAESDDASAKYLKQAGDFAVQQSYLSAAAGIAGGAAKGFGPSGSFSLAG